METCRFHPDGSGAVKCRKPVILRQIAAQSGLTMVDVEQMVCLEGTDDQRPVDCPAFNPLMVIAEARIFNASVGMRRGQAQPVPVPSSRFEALDPSRLP